MIFLKILQPLGNDFLVYYEAAKMFLLGLNPYHGLLTRTFPFNYPPPALLFLFPLAFFDFNTANIIWNLLSVASILTSIWLVMQISGLSKKFFLPLAVLFTIFFFPVKFDIGNAQINHFLLLFCALSFYFYQRSRKNLSAVFLAAASAIKIAPLIFVLYFVIRRDWQQLIRLVAFLLVLVAVSLFFVPISYQLVYLREVLPLSFTTGAKDWYYNQSLWGFLARSLPAAAVYLFYPLAAVALFLTWWRGRGLPCRRSLAAVSCLYLLIHPIALQHYFGFAIIPLILLLSRRDWPILAISYLLLAFDIKNFAAVPREFNFVLSHDFYGVLILWILALWQEKFWKIIGAIWVLSVTLAYLLMLLCRARFCF